jgi:hypothetical protein
MLGNTYLILYYNYQNLIIQGETKISQIKKEFEENILRYGYLGKIFDAYFSTKLKNSSA